MQCSIHDTIDADIPAIFALRLDPRVPAEQQRPAWFDNPQTFASNLAAPENWQGFKFKCTSILLSERLVGHVIQYHFRKRSRRWCDCGWNLEPDDWGRGIMPSALTMLFDKLFNEDCLDSVVASCFPTNTRCQRVMEKLGFEPQRQGLRERMSHFLYAPDFRRILKFRLTAEQWTRRAKSESLA